MSRERSIGGQGEQTLRWRGPLTRRAVWWAIAFAIPLVVTLAGAGIILWTVSRDSRSLTAMSFGVTLVFLGLGAAVACLGAWAASGGHHGPEDASRNQDTKTSRSSC